MMPYNDSWKIHRKTIAKVAGSNISVSVFERVQEAEAAHFLLDLLATPDDLFDHIRKYARRRSPHDLTTDEYAQGSWKCDSEDRIWLHSRGSSPRSSRRPCTALYAYLC